MPVYDFKCMNVTCNNLVINHRLESYKDDNPVCPTCGGHTTRLTSSNSIIFKGLPFGDNHYKGKLPKEKM